MSNEGEPSGVTPLTRADIPDLVRAVVAEMKKTTNDPLPGKSLNGSKARSQSSRDDRRAHAAALIGTPGQHLLCQKRWLALSLISLLTIQE